MIAAVAIDHLLNKATIENIGIAYVFCVYKSQLEQTLAALLSGLIKQLSQSLPTTPSAVEQLYKKHQTHGTRPYLEDLTKLLQEVCSLHSTTYIVVDALDECTDHEGARDKLINELLALKATTNLHLMLTSRPLPDIVEAFQGEPVFKVRASEDDVRQYVASQLPRLAKCVQRDEELKNKIKDEIAESVDGMYVPNLCQHMMR